MTNHFLCSLDDDTTVLIIKCFAPRHGHVQVVLLCGWPFFVLFCLWLCRYELRVYNKPILLFRQRLFCRQDGSSKRIGRNKV